MPVQLPKLPGWSTDLAVWAKSEPAPFGGSFFGPRYRHGLVSGWQFTMLYLNGGWRWIGRPMSRWLILGPGPWRGMWDWLSSPEGGGGLWVNLPSTKGVLQYPKSPYPPVNPPLIQAPMSSHPYYGPMRWN